MKNSFSSEIDRHWAAQKIYNDKRFNEARIQFKIFLKPNLLYFGIKAFSLAVKSQVIFSNLSLSSNSTILDVIIQKPRVLTSKSR